MEKTIPPKPKSGRHPSSVSSLDRSLLLLDILAIGAKPLSLTDIAEQAKMDKSAVFRMLRTFESHGYVVQDKTTKHYSLGLKPLHLAAVLNRELDLKRIARPYLESISNKTGQAIFLLQRMGLVALYTDKIDSTSGLTVSSQVGTIPPLHCTAGGKALLAFLPEAELEPMLGTNALRRHTANTIGDLAALREALRVVRNQEYAVDDEEFISGVRCVGTPVFDQHHQATGAISVLAPITWMTWERVSEVAPMLMKASQEISERMVWHEQTR